MTERVPGAGRRSVPRAGPEGGRSAARARLAADRASAEATLQALTRDFDGIVGSAAGDDEHDPEGATNAFERQHVAALIDQARRRLADTDAALRRLDAASYGTCERMRPADRRGPSERSPNGADLHNLRGRRAAVKPYADATAASGRAAPGRRSPAPPKTAQTALRWTPSMVQPHLLASA